MLYKIGPTSTYSGALNELEALQYQYTLFSQQKNKNNVAFFINGDTKDSESVEFFKYAKNKYDVVFYILTDIKLINNEILNIINNEIQYKILTSFMNLDKYFNVDTNKIILCEIEVATAYTLYLLKKADIQTLKNAKIDDIEFAPLYIGSIRNKRHFQIFEFIRHYKDKLDNNIKLRILSKTDLNTVKQYFNQNRQTINTNPAKYRYLNGNVIVNLNHLIGKLEFDDLNHFIDYTNTDITDFVEYLALIKKHNCVFFTDIEYLMFNYLQLRVFEALLVNKLYFIPHYLMNIEYVDDNTHFVMSKEHFKKILKRYNLYKIYEQLLNLDITEVDFKSNEFFEMLHVNNFDFNEYCQTYYKDKLNIFEYAIREY